MKDNILNQMETLAQERSIKTLNQVLELERVDQIRYLAHVKLIKRSQSGEN
jgi:hypothetical protein